MINVYIRRRNHYVNYFDYKRVGFYDLNFPSLIVNTDDKKLRLTFICVKDDIGVGLRRLEELGIDNINKFLSYLDPVDYDRFNAVKFCVLYGILILPKYI